MRYAGTTLSTQPPCLRASVCPLLLNVFVVPTTRINTMTFATPPASVAPDLCVIRRVGVTLWAMGFQSVWQFTVSASRSSGTLAIVASSVKHVGGMSIPAKIADVIVVLVVIPMARFKVGRAGADERFHDQEMYWPDLLVAVAEVDVGNTMHIVPRLEDSALNPPRTCAERDFAIKGPDTSVIGNLVQSFPADNREPSFGSHVQRLPQRAGGGIGCRV